MSYTLHHGHCLDVLRSLPEASVHCVVTSPPYWRMRDYQCEGQLGLEPTIEEYLHNQVQVFREVRRVLRGDGTLWLNMGDRYTSGGRGGYAGDLAPRAQLYSRKAGLIGKWQNPPPGFKDKELIGLPWRLALALQADGWWIRADCIWHKPNAKPESAKDRPGSAHEYVFLLARSRRYFYDWWAVREPASESERNRRVRQSVNTVRHYKLKRDLDSSYSFKSPAGQSSVFRSSIIRQKIALTGMRNMRSVWSIATRGYSGEHFATFPIELAERCIRAGTSASGCCAWCGAPYLRRFERGHGTDYAHQTLKAQGIHRIGNTEGTYEPPKFVEWVKGCDCSLSEHTDPCTVLDPYNGAGSCGVAAIRAGRRYVGIEINLAYIAQTRERLARVHAEISHPRHLDQ